MTDPAAIDPADWLATYGRAWAAGDGDTAAGLFTPEGVAIELDFAPDGRCARLQEWWMTNPDANR